MVSGEVDFEFATVLAAGPHIKSGRVTALAVTTAKRSEAYPNLPTMASIFPGFEVDNWYAMFMPAETPKAIVEKLHTEIVKALNAPDVHEYMQREGGQAVGSSPAELTDMFKREVAKYAKVIESGHIALQ